MKTKKVRTPKWFRHNFQIIEEKTGKVVAEVFDSQMGDLIAATPELLKLAKGFMGAIDDRISILNESLKECIREGYSDNGHADDINDQIGHWEQYRKEVQATISEAEKTLS